LVNAADADATESSRAYYEAAPQRAYPPISNRRVPNTFFLTLVVASGILAVGIILGPPLKGRPVSRFIFWLAALAVVVAIGFCAAAVTAE